MKGVGAMQKELLLFDGGRETRYLGSWVINDETDQF